VEGQQAEVVPELRLVCPEEVIDVARKRAHAAEVGVVRAKECFAPTHAEVNRCEVQRQDGMRHELENRLVQAEDNACENRERCRHSDDGEHAGACPDGNGERDFVGSDALRELREHGVKEVAFPQGARRGGAAVRGRGRRWCCWLLRVVHT